MKLNKTQGPRIGKGLEKQVVLDSDGNADSVVGTVYQKSSDNKFTLLL